MDTPTSDPKPAPPTDNAIAVIGLACRFPGAPGIAEYWANLRAGRESIQFHSRDVLRGAGFSEAQLAQPNFVGASSTMAGVDLFDPGFFGLTAREADVLDPQHRVFLECAWEALEAAGHGVDDRGTSVGVYAGAGLNSYFLQNVLPRLSKPGALSHSQALLGNGNDFLATRTSYCLNLVGPSVNVQSACSTSLVAIHLACQALLLGECDVALAGGVTITVPHRPGYFHHDGGIDSRDGHCRAFDQAASGTIGASGAGVVALKRLEAAEADGDKIHAVIRGTAINNDGAAKLGFTAPGSKGQAAVIATALAVSGVAPGDISFVEAHGTGTRLGDPVELKALSETYRAGTDKTGYCAIGSVKTNLGHLDAAAGAAGFIKAVLALEHGELPPSLHYSEPNPEIPFAASPFFVNTTLRRLEPRPEPHRAGVSSFGIGGTNAHCILEQYAAPFGAGSSAHRRHVFPLSARSGESLDAYRQKLLAQLTGEAEPHLADLAFTLQRRRRSHAFRHAIVADSAAELVAALAAPLAASRPSGPAPAYVFLFPGQGSQYPGMARDLWRCAPVFRREFAACAEILRPEGIDLEEIVYGSDDVALARTSVAQPALFAVEYALARQLQALGLAPSALLGHSLGEYVAAAVSGVLSREAALRLVAWRGRLMQDAPPGAMLAIRASAAELRPLLDPALEIAADNAPDSCVVSGPTDTIECFAAELERRGRPGQRLRTSHAFHSRLMEPVIPALRAALQDVDFQAPQIPYISNLTGTWITADQARDPEYWLEHLRKPVRFAAGLAEVAGGAESLLLEVGPGTALKTLAARQLGDDGAKRIVSLLPHAAERTADEAVFKKAVARLWQAGAVVRWETLWGDERRAAAALPSYAFDHKRYWIDPLPPAEAPAPAVAPANDRADVAAWCYRPSWRSGPTLPRFGGVSRASKTCWLVHGGGERGDRLAAMGRAQGIEIERAAAGYAEGPADSTALENYRRLWNEWKMAGRVPSCVIFCDALEEVGGASRHALGLGLTALTRAFAAVYPGRDLSVVVLTQELHVVHGSEAAPAELACLLGFAKVLPQELPGIMAWNLDVDAAFLAGATSDWDLAAVFAARQSHVVAIRGRRCWRQGIEEATPPPGDEPPRLRRGGRYLITGGLGPIGQEIAAYLARNFHATVVLTTRESAGSDSESPRVAQVRARFAAEGTAGFVHLRRADVASRAEMELLLANCEREFGPFDGVVHAAGITGAAAHRPLERLEAASLDAMYQAKVIGAGHLLDLFAPRPVEFIVFCSSLASLLGGVGFAGYAGANCVLDALAQRARAAGMRGVLSLNWDGWGTAGAPNETRLLAPDEGVAAFVHALRFADDAQLHLSRTDLASRLARASVAEPARFDSALGVPSVHPRPQLATPYLEASTSAERIVRDIWREALGLDRVGVNDSFFDLGGDSLLGISIVAKIRKAFSFDLRASQLYEAPTVAAIARIVQGDEPADATLRASEERGTRRKQNHRNRRERRTAVLEMS